MDPLSCLTLLHPIREPEDVGSLRRGVRQVVRAVGGEAAESARVELAATELGTNILNHAGASGYVLIQPVPEVDGAGVEVVAVDRGPGMSDVDRAIHGGPTPIFDPATTTAVQAGPRGLGCGLASVHRLASEFDIYSAPGWGTAVLARFRFPVPRLARTFPCGGVAVPLSAGDVSGDAWAFRDGPAGASAVLADGLGHGPGAARAAAPAVQAFRANEHRDDLEQYLRLVHEALRSTRGAAVSVCRIAVDVETVFFAGIGNVEGRIYVGDTSSGLAPRNGTLGLGLSPPKIQVREYRWSPGALLILYSDGIRSHFDLGVYRNLQGRDPTLIAAVLHRDLTRERDDATVVVVKDTRVPQS